MSSLLEVLLWALFPEELRFQWLCNFAVVVNMQQVLEALAWVLNILQAWNNGLLGNLPLNNSGSVTFLNYSTGCQLFFFGENLAMGKLPCCVLLNFPSTIHAFDIFFFQGKKTTNKHNITRHCDVEMAITKLCLYAEIKSLLIDSGNRPNQMLHNDL